MDDSPFPGTIRVESANSPGTIELLRELQPDVVVVAGTRILSKALLISVPATFINWHAGITPLYRGVHGGYWSLVEERADECGVTVHLVDAGIDTGGGLAQARIRPTLRDNFVTYPYLQLGAALPLLASAVRDAIGRSVVPVEPPAGTDWHGYVEDGVSVNSSGPDISISGLPTPEAKRKITAWLESKHLGKKTINYKLRDWLFSRQRYWGEPFPIVWKTGPDGHTYHEALPESALPLFPPALADYKPTPDGQPPLARAQNWVTLPDGSKRETNTMPQWAGSCWYYLRYLDARNDNAFCSSEAERYWMGAQATPVLRSSTAEGGRTTQHATRPTPGVDLYVGGTEHAVLHLLYARFWHKVLFDLGHVSTAEPFSGWLTRA